MQKLLGLLAVVLVAIFVVSQAISQPPERRNDKGRPERNPPRFELGQVYTPEELEQLKLTPEQEKELETIKQDLKARLDKLLTDEQKKKLADHRPPPPPGDQGDNRPQQRAAPAGPALNRAPQAKLKKLPQGTTRIPVTFSGGYETDPRDRGRPVILIAAALGVTSDVFRDAFSNVRPARGGAEPEPAQVRQNKSVLMAALGKYGITNDRLDTVSNYYRYPPGRGNLWQTQPAVANALVKDGEIIGYEIVSGGSGYSSVPTVSIPDVKGAIPKVEVSYGTEFETNGAVTGISAQK